MPLTRGESLLLRSLGIALQQYAAQTSVYLFSYGVFMILFSASIVIFRGVLWRRGFSNRVTAAMFAATVFNFILYNVFIGSLLAAWITFIRKAFIVSVDVALADRVELINNAVHTADLVLYWAITLPPLVSDLIVIWRAWVMFQDQRWVIVLPGILWIGTVALTLGYNILLFTPAGFHAALTTGAANSLSLSGIVLSTATNMVATLMIGYKLWRHRVLIVRNLGLGKRQTPVQKVMILLVETGIIYCCFQIAFLVMGHFEPNPNPAFAVFNTFYFSLAAMYPTIVVVLVETQRSLAETIVNCDASSHKYPSPQAGEKRSEVRVATVGYLSFARGPITSSSSGSETIEGMRVFSQAARGEC